MTQLQQDNLFLKSLKVSETEVLKNIQSAIDNNSGKLVTYFNQNSFNEYYSNPEFRKILQSNFEIFSDGKGMSFALRYLFGIKADRFNATDLYARLFDKLYNRNIPVYIIGGNYDNKTLNEKIKDKVILAGYTNGYFDNEEIDCVIGKIKNTHVKIIGLGMGTANQEILAAQISLQVKNCIILCVGNFFNFYLGITKRAPKFIRNSGLEWAYRLFHEPGKLWKRYLIGIPKFLIKVINLKYL